MLDSTLCFLLFYRLEEFTYVHQETLSDLSTLLRYPKASSIRKENLLKCIVINIFSVHNIMEKNGIYLLFFV